MALTGTQENLYQWLKGSLPGFLFASDDAAHETWEAIAVALSGPYETIVAWLTQTFIAHAEGAWLDLLGRERGMWRRASESDDAFRARIRSVEDLVTRPSLEAAGDAVLTASGLPTGVQIVNLRRERAYFSTSAAGKRTAYFRSSTGVIYRMGAAIVRGASASTRVTNSATIDGSATKRRDLWHPGRMVVITPFGPVPTSVRSAIEAVIGAKKAAGLKALHEYRET